MVNVRDNFAEFRFFRPGATSVYLAGDFNGWRANQLRMTPAGDGYWVAGLRLARGTYRFGYLADGQWYADYAAFGVEAGPFGLDGVLRIAPNLHRASREGGTDPC